MKITELFDFFSARQKIRRASLVVLSLIVAALIALVLFLISLGFFLPVLVQYFRTGAVARFPTLIVCGFTMIAAVQAFFAGMILGCIIQKNRQDFEINLQRSDERLKHLQRIRDAAEYVQVEIEDNGKGISAADLPNIFERFYRADASRNSATGGHGVGLSVAKAIVTAHKGKISAVCPDGKTVVFTATL